jgi:RES domain-containing protein
MRRTLFDGTGAMIYGARWNSLGRRVIYAAETYSGAMLEVLAHTSEGLPKGQGFIEIEIPAGIGIERITQDLPGWASPHFRASRSFGDRWYDQRRSAVLIVPSVVARMERNVLINQEHPEFELIRATRPQPVKWDERLWRN